MGSHWTVDSIHRMSLDVPGMPNPYWLRLLCYHPDWENAVGHRNLLASGEILNLGNPSQGADDPRLGFGLTFQIDWDAIRDRGQRIYRANESAIFLFQRMPEIERTLRTFIGDTLERTDKALGGDFEDSGNSVRETPFIKVYRVGQGDTVLLKLAENRFWLVDAYAWKLSLFDDFADDLQSLKCHKLEKLIITHFHQDHVRRAKEIIERFNPDEIIVPNHCHPTAMVRNLMHWGSSRIRTLLDVQTYNFGSVSVTLLPTDLFHGLSSDPNEHAIVLAVSGLKGQALLAADVPGDLLQQAVGRIPAFIAKKQFLYKVSHHCSRTGIPTNRLLGIQPTVAVTSCSANNRFKHPHDDANQFVMSLLSGGLHHKTYQDGSYSFPI